MYVVKPEEQGLRPLHWHTATSSVMWRKMNHTYMIRLIIYTCVNMPICSQACRYRMCIWKDQTQIVSLYLHTYRHELRCTQSESDCSLWCLLQVRSWSCSAQETFLPLDLSAGVPLNSAYIPSVHPDPLRAPLCSPALKFCQGIH